MNCYWCNTELIIGGDIDIEDGMNGYPEFSIMTNLSCPKCESFVEVYLPKHHFEEKKEPIDTAPCSVEPDDIPVCDI